MNAGIAGWLAALDAAIFAALGALHVYWALGGRRGADLAVPTRPAQEGQRSTDPPRFLFKPSRLGTLAVALAMFAAAAVLLGRVGWFPRGGPMAAEGYAAGTWLLAALFLGRAVGEFRTVGFFKRVRGTRFAVWDSRLFSPLCLVIAALAALTALLGP